MSVSLNNVEPRVLVLFNVLLLKAASAILNSSAVRSILTDVSRGLSQLVQTNSAARTLCWPFATLEAFGK